MLPHETALLDPVSLYLVLLCPETLDDELQFLIPAPFLYFYSVFFLIVLVTLSKEPVTLVTPTETLS